MRIEKIPDIGKYAEHLLPETNIVEVAQGTWKHSNGELMTMDVATCIVLAAHNVATGTGLLGHFSSISPEAQANPALANEPFDTEKFHEAAAALSTLGPPEFTYVWMGGAAPAKGAPLLNSGIMADREYGANNLRATVAEADIAAPAVVIDWNETEYDLLVRLDCVNGSLLIQRIDEPG